jgi:hypothetical protein
MKRLFTALLILIYATPLFATEVHVHYCMNKVTGWSLISSSKSLDCNKCGMKDAKCCKDEIKIVKSSNDNYLFSTVKIQGRFQYEYSPKLVETYIYTFNSDKASIRLPLYHAPPDLLSNNFQSLYCHFRI